MRLLGFLRAGLALLVAAQGVACGDDDDMPQAPAGRAGSSTGGASGSGGPGGGSGAAGGGSGAGLDASFGVQGVAKVGQITSNSTYLGSVAVDPQGRIYVGGGSDRARIARLLADGRLDPSFGEGGVLAPAHDGFAGRWFRALPDGKIVLNGDDYDRGGRATLVRLNGDGSPDLLFGNGGVVAPPLPVANTYFTLLDAGAWGDRLVLLGGGLFFDAAAYSVFALRLRADGSRDPGFGGPDLLATYDPSSPDFFSAFASAGAMRVRPDGSVLVVGSGFRRATEGDPDGSDCLLLRFTAAGDLDPSLDGDGALYAALRSEDHPAFDRASCNAIDEAPDGKIVLGGQVAGYVTPEPSDNLLSDFVITRRLPDGSPDPGFGQNGVFSLHVGGYESLRGLAVAPDGSIVAVGEANYSLVVIKLRPDGTLDTDFNAGTGVLLGAAAPSQAFARQADGKLLVAGMLGNDDNFDYSPAVARFNAP